MKKLILPIIAMIISSTTFAQQASANNVDSIVAVKTAGQLHDKAEAAKEKFTAAKNELDAVSQASEVSITMLIRAISQFNNAANKASKDDLKKSLLEEIAKSIAALHLVIDADKNADMAEAVSKKARAEAEKATDDIMELKKIEK